MGGKRLAQGAVTLGLLLAGCGGGGETNESAAPLGPPQELKVTLAGDSTAEYLGILVAQKRQFFADANMLPFIASPAEPRRAVSYVVDGTDELGVAHLAQVVKARAAGDPVVLLGSVVSQPTMAMIWLQRSKIDSLPDLKGKTIAVPGIPVQKEFLREMLARAGVSPADVKLADVGSDLVPALLSGRADAIFGGSENIEGAELQTRGATPIVTTPQAFGVPDYEELVLIARADTVAKDPGLPRGFLTAMTRGVEAAAEDPQEATEAVDKSVWANPETDRQAARAQVEATLPLLSANGKVDPGRVQDLIDWMARKGMIVASFSASELIAGEAPPG
jgi:putative hydroxymethylpyrimidine transport system substrate-binding protein